MACWLHAFIEVSSARPGEFEARTVKNGCVDCRFKARAVSVDDCRACSRGYVVEIKGDPALALCPTDTFETTVDDVMSRRVLWVRPEATIESLILLLIDEDIYAAPVVDASQTLIGVASKSDVVFDHYEWAELRDEACSLRRLTQIRDPEAEEDMFLTELLRSKTVGDIMCRTPLVLTPQMPLVHAARLMAERHVQSAPVVDSQNRLVGLITSTDLARWLGRQR